MSREDASVNDKQPTPIDFSIFPNVYYMPPREKEENPEKLGEKNTLDARERSYAGRFRYVDTAETDMYHYFPPIPEPPDRGLHLSAVTRREDAKINLEDFCDPCVIEIIACMVVRGVSPWSRGFKPRRST